MESGFMDIIKIDKNFKIQQGLDPKIVAQKLGVICTFLGVQTPPTPPTLMDSNGIFSVIDGLIFSLI